MYKVFLASVFCLLTLSAQAQTEVQVAPQNNPAPPKKMSVRKETPARYSTEPDAADYTTDLIYISKAGQFGLSAQVGYISGYLAFSGANSTFDGFLSNFSAQYGVDSYLNFYINQSYQNYNTTTDTSPESTSSQRGIGDTTFGAKGSLYLTPGFLWSYEGFYRAGLLAKAEFDSSKANETSSTAVSERPRVGATVTFVAVIENLSFGANLGGEMFQEGKYNSINGSGSRDATQSAGTASSFLFFGQYDFGVKVGAGYLISNQDPYENNVNGTITRNSGTKSNAVRIYGILPLGAFEVGAGLTKPNFVNTAVPVTTNLYLTDAFIRARF